MGILETVRAAALPGVWSQGVKLAREGAVTIEAQSPKEATARVLASGPTSPETTLFLEDLEWSCDCDAKVDPCAHVVAVAIAVVQGPPAGVAPVVGAAAVPASPKAPAPLRVGYRLTVTRGTLYCARELLGGAVPQPLDSLASRVARREPILAGQLDHEVDRLALSFHRGLVPTAKLMPLFEALEAAKDVTLDGAPVRTRRDPIKPIARIVDGGADGISVRVERPLSGAYVVAAGVGREGEVLAPLGALSVAGEKHELLPITRPVSRGQMGSFIADTLPGLERDMDVRIETKRLPARSGVDKPRITLETETGDGVVWLMPLVVYGDPIVARVDQGELVLLGDRVPRRSVSDEQTLVQRLRDDHNLVPGRRVAFKPNEAAKLLHGLSAIAGGAGLVQHKELVPLLGVNGTSLSLVFTFEDARGETRELPGETVVSAFRQGLSLVPLPTGGFAPLPADWLSKHGAKIAELLAARDSEGKVHPALTPALLELCETSRVPAPQALREAVHALDMGSTEPVLPPGLQADLRQYQREGIAFLQRARRLGLGALLADDMGLGKTLQAIAALEGPALVVCPRSVLFNWEREIERFRPGLKVCLFHGASRTLDPAADVVLTTYGTLRNELPLLTGKAWDTVIIDEAQTIKNPDSQSARAVFALHGAKFRVALSGTPVENRLEELFSITHFANPGLLGTRADFRALIGDPVERGDAEATARLRRKLRPVLLRRTKAQVAADLPPRTDSVLFVEFEEDERALYEAMRLAARSDVQKRMSEGASPMAALEALLRLRQAACHASLLPGQERGTSSKVQRLVHALTAARDDGHRALVFSQWTGLLDLIEPELRAGDISFCRLDGSTRDRAGVVDTFQDDSGPTAMLVSLKAGGTGLNLTAADHVFLLDPWWNPAAEDQAADRAHRIGQERPVMVHRLVTKDTVEERVLALQQKKREIAAAALEGSALGAQLTKDDLLALLD